MREDYLISKRIDYINNSNAHASIITVDTRCNQIKRIYKDLDKNLKLYMELSTYDQLDKPLNRTTSANILSKLYEEYTEETLLKAVGLKCTQEVYELFSGYLSSFKLLYDVRNDLIRSKDDLESLVPKIEKLLTRYDIDNLCKTLKFDTGSDIELYIDTLKSQGFDKESDTLNMIYNVTSNIHTKLPDIETYKNAIKAVKYLTEPSITILFTSTAHRNGKVNNLQLHIGLDRLESLIKYIESVLLLKNSAKLERGKMTDYIRYSIQMRDNFTCQICGASSYDDTQLLLEVDHIIPVSKGGRTEPNNLQTLCWKCNRSKGAKLL